MKMHETFCPWHRRSMPFLNLCCMDHERFLEQKAVEFGCKDGILQAIWSTDPDYLKAVSAEANEVVGDLAYTP